MSSHPSPFRAQRALPVLLSAVLGAGGCAVKVSGLARPTPAGPTVETREGEVYRLVTSPDSVALAALDGHEVVVEGQRAFGAVRVTDWQVVGGLHGMPVWVGEVRGMGAQIGVDDRNSGAFYWVDDHAAQTLDDHVGEVVLLEGYVDGPHRIRVMYWRPLSPGAVVDGLR